MACTFVFAILHYLPNDNFNFCDLIFFTIIHVLKVFFGFIENVLFLARDCKLTSLNHFHHSLNYGVEKAQILDLQGFICDCFSSHINQEDD